MCVYNSYPVLFVDSWIEFIFNYCIYEYYNSVYINWHCLELPVYNYTIVDL
jgi:hypothetical protein